MIPQELYQRWNEIQNWRARNEAVGEQDCLSEELNLLEALRLLDCKTIPGEASDVRALINDRHRRLEKILGQRTR